MRWMPQRRIMADDAASDVVGSLLLIGITVAMAAAAGLAIISIDGPDDEVHLDLAMTAKPGTGGWGTGDESIVLSHRGGEGLPRTDVSVVILQNAVPTTYSGVGLDGGWSDGTLTIGETWSVTLTIDADDSIIVRVVDTGPSGIVLASGTLRGGTGVDCSLDIAAPTVDTWVQSPSDITDETSGAATVTATLTDDCAGVDQTMDPHLEYRIVSNVTWNDVGAMTRIAANRWSGAIPDLGWSGLGGEVLEYRLTGMQDRSGNSGTSATQSDNITIALLYSYPDTFTAIVGDVTSFSASQSALDSGAAASLVESKGGGDFNGTSAVGTGAVNASEVDGGPDDVWGMIDTNGDNIIVDGFDITGFTGTITSVEILMESHVRILPIDDDLSIAYYHTSWHTVQSDYVPVLDVLEPYEDEELVIDISNELPSWTWQDIEDLRLRVRYDKQGSPDAVNFYIDALTIRVGTSETAHSLEVEYDMPTLPPSTLGTLEMIYETTGDTYHVEVWDGSTWNTRGATLNAGVPTLWTYSLTATEQTADAGEPLIRFVDDTPGGPSQGTLQLDYVRVVNG